tara:strand:- start:83 stop:376 length:294 start_codon:yes stop_codon:yes gene_type:complete
VATIIERDEFIIGTAEDLGCDPEGGRWVAICKRHMAIGNWRTLRAAKGAIVMDELGIPRVELCQPCEYRMTDEQAERYLYGGTWEADEVLREIDRKR